MNWYYSLCIIIVCLLIVVTIVRNLDTTFHIVPIQHMRWSIPEL